MNKCGSITVYLSLILTVVLGLVCTLIESGRINAIDAKVNGITYMGLDSSFAGYASPLFRDYGVLFLWPGNEQFTDVLEGYISYNLNVQKGLFVENIDLYKINLRNIDVLDIHYATGENGEIFASQVEQYMKFGLAGDILKEISGQIDFFNQGKALNKFYDKIQQFQEVFTKVETNVGEIKEAIEKVKGVKEKPEELIDSLLVKATGIKEDMLSGGGGSIKLMEFQSQVHLLNGTKDKLIQGLEDIRIKTGDYFTSAQEAKKAINVLVLELSNSKETFDEETYRILDDELKSLDSKTADNEQDYYGINKNMALVNNYLSNLKRLGDFFGNNFMEPGEENIDEIISGLTQLSEEFSGFAMENLDIAYSVNSIPKEEAGILDYIKNLMNEGVLGLVIDNPGQISGELVENTGLPSLDYNPSPDSNGLGDIVENSPRKAVYGEYLIRHFGNYVNVFDDTKLSYELEYILEGKNSDKENLAAVVNDLILLREGCNLIYLLKDSAKRNEALQMATALAGFTGLPVLVTVTQFAILAAWAYGESILDVRNLLSGEKVPILKEGSEWNLSLKGVKNLSNLADSPNSTAERGLNYSQYLRIALLMQDKTVQYYRTMDVIQMNICKRENVSFRLGQCIDNVKVKVDYTANTLFTTLPFVKRLFHYREGKYQFGITQKYGY